MKFSVIIVNYDSWPLVVRCVRSIYATGYDDFEVVVVDNDRVAPPKLPGSVHLIRNRANLGFARACNRGISASRGEFVVLMNPDAAVEGTFFERIEGFLAARPQVGVVGPRVLDRGGKTQLSARREISVLSGLLGRTSLLTRLLPKSALVRSQFPAVTGQGISAPVDWVSGACMVIRSQVLRDVGTLDERFFMYFEDADLCRRVRAAGWRVYYLTCVEVTHQTGGSSRSKPKAIWLLHKSAFLYHRKHGSRGPLGVFDLLVLLGLTGRALGKLATWMLGLFFKGSGTSR